MNAAWYPGSALPEPAGWIGELKAAFPARRWLYSDTQPFEWHATPQDRQIRFDTFNDAPRDILRWLGEDAKRDWTMVVCRHPGLKDLRDVAEWLNPYQPSTLLFDPGPPDDNLKIWRAAADLQPMAQRGYALEDIQTLAESGRQLAIFRRTLV